MTSIERIARELFASQPFSRYLGATLELVGAEAVEVAVTLDDKLKQQHGFAHGGVISYLADNSITFAGGLALGCNALTSEFKINYVRPAIGQRLVARARAAAAGKRQAVCQSEVFAIGDDDSETLCAIAQGTVVAAPDRVSDKDSESNDLYASLS